MYYELEKDFYGSEKVTLLKVVDGSRSAVFFCDVYHNHYTGVYRAESHGMQPTISYSELGAVISHYQKWVHDTR